MAMAPNGDLLMVGRRRVFRVDLSDGTQSLVSADGHLNLPFRIAVAAAGLMCSKRGGARAS